jgi:hypothetical protein
MLHLKKKKLVGRLGMAKPWDEAMKKVVEDRVDSDWELASIVGFWQGEQCRARLADKKGE